MKFSAIRLVSLIGLLFIVLVPFGIGQQISIFINIPAIIGIVGFTFFMLLLSFGRDFLVFIPNSLSVFCFSHQSTNAKFAEIALYGSRVTIGGASILTLTTYIKSLFWNSDPITIGASLAVSILPILYALIISEIYFTIVYKTFADSTPVAIGIPAWRNLLLPVVIVLVVLMGSFLALLAFA